MSEHLLQDILRSVARGTPQHSFTTGQMEKPLNSNKFAICNDSSSLDGTPISTCSSGPVRFDLTYIRSCRSVCSCSCHKLARLRSPSILDNVLGTLFVRYNSRPLTAMSSYCNISSCQRPRASAAEITYTFPQWFIQRMVTIKAQPTGPEFLVRVFRVRPKNTAIFLALENNNVEIAKELLSAGDASVLDINQEGQSLIHVRHPSSHVLVINLTTVQVRLREILAYPRHPQGTVGRWCRYDAGRQLRSVSLPIPAFDLRSWRFNTF